MEAFEFILNGQRVHVAGVDPSTTLLSYLRSLGKTGSKEVCAEGECGACAVVIRKQGRFVALNSCLTILPTIAGQEVFTAEGLAQQGHLHPVQNSMVKHLGSQCGFCTPGFVMSMFAEYYREKENFDLEAISGNLCRCTGYRPIRDAARDLANPAPEDTFSQLLSQPEPERNAVEYQANQRLFLRPVSLAEFFEHYQRYPHAVLVAGGTDVVVDINHNHLRPEVMISLEAIAELGTVQHTSEYLDIGAAVPLGELEEHLKNTPMFSEVLKVFGSRLIRNRATLGGNLATASPVGDSASVLLALEAQVVLVSPEQERVLPLSEFFVGYRSTALQSGEIIRAIRIPHAWGVSRFYKIAKRPQDDITSVSFAMQLKWDKDQVAKACIGITGLKNPPARAYQTEAFLQGKPWNEDTVTAASEILQNELNPSSNIRASKAYRTAMLGEMLHKFYTEVVHE